MRAWHWAGFAVCGGMTALVIWQWRQPLPQPVEVTPTVASAGITPAQSNELTSLREQTRELARLRNEVGQLRAKKVEIDSARAENARLVSTVKQAEALPPRETPPGFVSKDKLANVGFASPEDSVQTFFWALREGNLRMVMQSISPNDKERQRFEKMPPEQLAKMEQKAERINNDELKSFTEFGVRSKEMISDDSVVLHIGPSFSTNTMKFRLERTLEGWKLRDPLSGF